ncbi:MAG: hypothetical protein WD771_05345 [Gemmatimonadaceae bacterium]
MKPLRFSVIVGAIALLAAASSTGCRRAIVIVPQTERGYTATDTLWGRYKGNNVRVTFRFDTLWRRDTVTRLDTLWRAGTRTLVRVDTLLVLHVDTVVRRDTVRVTVRDTIRVTVRDTIRVTVRDTVRLAGRRQLFVPPGQYPPDGQCRVWVHDLPPGRQAAAAPCNALGTIPAGAFILFRGDAWDFDYDWVEEARRGAVPPEIVALKRRGGR